MVDAIVEILKKFDQEIIPITESIVSQATGGCITLPCVG